MNIIIGIVFIVAGVVSATVLRSKNKNAVLDIKYMQTKSVQDLKDIFSQMESSGLSDYREFVELKGNVTNDTLTETPFSNEQVAYCESKVTKVTEYTESYRDSEGRSRTRTRTDKDVISEEKSSQDIYIKDASSDEAVVLEINASGCELDIPKTFSRFENRNNVGNYKYFNSRNFGNYGSNTTGFTLEEKTISQGQNLYAIGEAYKVGNTIHIGKPMDSKKPFIVTTKSEEDFVNTSNKKATANLFGGILLAIIGIVMIFLIK